MGILKLGFGGGGTESSSSSSNNIYYRMKKRNSSSSSSSATTEIYAMATKMQDILGMPVLVREFYRAGKYLCKSNPSSVVTIQPFVPGGQRRLVLNLHHPLILSMAKETADSCNKSNNNHGHHHHHLWLLLKQMAFVMVKTSSWPAPMDTPCPRVTWKMAKGLICGPHWNLLGPIQHEEIMFGNNNNHDNSNTTTTNRRGIAIWPRRIHHVFLKVEGGAGGEGGTENETAIEKDVTLLGERWDRRDDILFQEWMALLSSSSSSCNNNNNKTKKNNKNMKNKKTTSSTAADHFLLAGTELRFLTYAPSLPIVLLAQSIIQQQQQQQSRQHNNIRCSSPTAAEALSVATMVLLSIDKLFCLSIFFGVPLIDRTKTWINSIKVDCIVPPPPTRQEIHNYQKRLVVSSSSSSLLTKATTNANTANDDSTTSTTTTTLPTPLDALEETMLQRASSLWSKSATIIVAWSGGIDSTAALVCLLRTKPPSLPLRDDGDAIIEHNNKKQLKILYDDASIQENRSFFHTHIEGKLDCIERNRRTLSEVAAAIQQQQQQQQNDTTILVTGELGDQLFGSDRCRSAFPPDEFPQNYLTPEEKEFLKFQTDEVSFESLDMPWEQALLPVLDELGLLCGGNDSWKGFFEQQINKSPLPIETLYDLLWWLNFSCKWQNVSLRCLHDGGDYHPPPHPKQDDDRDNSNYVNITGSIVHFYQDRDLECWSCVPEYHRAKFPNLKDWKTYKQPLKDLIHKFHQDDAYRRDKCKTGSLTFALDEERGDRVERVLGLVRLSDGTVARMSSGVLSIMDLSNEELNKWKKDDGTSIQSVDELLEPWLTSSTESKPPMMISTDVVNPWGEHSQPSAFDAAPQFADTDERQRRVKNPVTKTTLIGKCSALLPPDLVKGKRVLDLGACLGAMCHWCLYYGCSEVVGVEPQSNFCERMQQLLNDAAPTWPPDTRANGSSSNRFQVVCAEAKEFLNSCPDNSFDIIVAAGVLHCFQDPVSVITEMSRVAPFLCIESVHTTYHVSGFQDIESSISTSTGLLELAPSAAVNKAGDDASYTGLAVVPSESLMRSLLSAIGYHITRVTLEEHPTKNIDVLTYTGNRRYQASPVRFFLRCCREAKTVRVRSLEECVTSGVGNEKRWGSKRFGGRYWTDYDHAGLERGDEPSEEVDKDMVNGLLPPLGPPDSTVDPGLTEKTPGSWSFDENVARRFRNEAASHIPDYVDVVQTCMDCIIERFGKASLENLHVVDVGCAIGYTMIELLKFGFRNVYGYDTAPSMLKVAEQNLEEATNASSGAWDKENYHLFLAEVGVIVPSNPHCEFDKGNLDVIVVNWTLHFIVDEQDRRNYLRQLYETLKPGGMLLLTEKTQQDDVTRELYYHWKEASPQNVPREVIEAKRSKLKGVLETLSPRWYLETLEACGYENVTVVRAKFAFVTFLCYKPIIMTEKVADSKSFVRWSDVEKSAADVHFDGNSDPEPFLLSAWSCKSQQATVEETDPARSTFGYVYSGEATLTRTLRSGRTIDTLLVGGMYFACFGKFHLRGGSGFIASSPTSCASPLFTVGGPLEDEEEGEGLLGKLPYIDGCTDTLLIPPVVMGAPCLNHLHFPANITQTQHTHPSGRAGMVTRGSGTCRVVDPVSGDATLIKLEAGMVFCIPRHSAHAFETKESETLDVIAFHPDSDFGPTPTNHPMLNRTIIDGVSASLLPSIQTKD